MLPGADGPRGEIVARRVLARLQPIKVEAAGERLAAAHLGRARAWRPQMSGEDLLERARGAALRRPNGEPTPPHAPASAGRPRARPAETRSARCRAHETALASVARLFIILSCSPDQSCGCCG